MDFITIRRRKKESVVLEMTPLIDVVFLLLIFFMVTTTFSEQTTGINVKLPESSIEEVVETREIIVTVTKNKDIYINTKKVSIRSFGKVLRQTLKNTRKANVIIRGDKYVDYGFVVKVMTISKQAGARVLDIATELAE